MTQLRTFPGVLINPCVTPKQRESMVEMDQRSSLRNIYSALKKICRIINHICLPLKLHSIHYRGLEFILLILCLAWQLTCWPLCPWGGPAAAAAQHAPGLAHHWPCGGMCFGRKDRLGSAPLRVPLSTLRNSISYEDLIHFLLFFLFFYF